MLIDIDIPGIQIIAWILFSIIEGIREGAKDSHGGSNGNYPFNIHYFYIPTRLVVGALCVCLLSDISLDETLFLTAFSLPLVFPFFHDGAYYMTRKRLEPHRPDLVNYHWLGWSDTTTARFSLSPQWRSTFVIAGFLVFNFKEIWWYGILFFG